MTTGPARLRVGFVGGTRPPGNVRTFLRNVRDLLFAHPARFDRDLIVRKGIEDLPRGIGSSTRD